MASVGPFISSLKLSRSRSHAARLGMPIALYISTGTVLDG